MQDEPEMEGSRKDVDAVKVMTPDHHHATICIAARVKEGVIGPLREVHNWTNRTAGNDSAFPAACTIRFKFAARGNMPDPDLYWYDGGIKPRMPVEPESVMAGFNGQTPRLITAGKVTPPWEAETSPQAGRRANPWPQAFNCTDRVQTALVSPRGARWRKTWCDRPMRQKIHEIRDPIHVFIRLDTDERRVLNSWPLQRLRHIHQLALTYLV